MTVKVEGVADAMKALEKQGRTIGEALAEVPPIAAEAIRDDARRNAPKDSGDLRDAIGYELDGDTAEVKILNASRQGVWYAHFVEFGTSRQAAQPFMGPAAETERGRLRSRVVDAVQRGADAN